MRMPSLSEIGKGPLFEHKDIMGMGEGIPYDENWSANKEMEIVNNFKRGEDGLVNKDNDLRKKSSAAIDKLRAGEMDAKTRLFGNQSFNMNFNMKMPRGGNMYNKNYSKKVEDIMGKSKKASKSNYENKVSMVMGKQGGGFNIKGFDMKTKNYFSMGGGGMKNPMQKSKMFAASGGAPKHMNEYFGGAPKPTGKVNINALIGGAKTKGMPNMGIPGNGGMIMGVKNDLTAQSKINNMLGQNMTGAKNIEVLARMGMMKKPENIAWNRVNTQKNLNLWGDADGDKVANVLDCQPMNSKMQGFWGDVGGAIGTGIQKVSGAVVRSPRAAYNIAKYGQGYGGFEVGESIETKKQKKLRTGFEREKLATERERTVGVAKYGTEEEYTKALEQEQKMKELELTQKTEIVKTFPESQAKLMKARADLIRAQRVVGSVKGKKGKYTDVYGPVSQEEISPISAFGSGAGVAQMSEIGSTGAGLGMAQLGSTGVGFQMTGLPSDGQGMGFSRMANIKSGSGQGFHQMLGIEQPIQEISQEVPQPIVQAEAPVVQTASGETMMIDGVQYNKLPSGKWKNTKTGKDVIYPRGKYGDK